MVKMGTKYWASSMKEILINLLLIYIYLKINILKPNIKFRPFVKQSQTLKKFDFVLLKEVSLYKKSRTVWKNLGVSTLEC